MTERSQGSEANEDQTWLDFLRSAGGTVMTAPSSSSHQANPSSSSTSGSATLPRPPIARDQSSDRKRRLTTAVERRNYPYVAPGTTRAAAIDLSTPPRQQGHQRGHTTGSVMFGAYQAQRESRTTQRRPSDMPPPWQPDAEVSKCPVCDQEFGFLFRKHHCRKCGRVVCSNCSPHRITIPREYIVQPPGLQDGPPMMGGVEVVRVCKPCVPDPWTPPTPSQSQTQQQTSSSATPRPVPTPPTRRASEASQSRYRRRPSAPVPTMPPNDGTKYPWERDRELERAIRDAPWHRDRELERAIRDAPWHQHGRHLPAMRHSYHDGNRPSQSSGRPMYPHVQPAGFPPGYRLQNAQSVGFSPTPRLQDRVFPPTTHSDSDRLVATPEDQAERLRDEVAPWERGQPMPGSSAPPQDQASRQRRRQLREDEECPFCFTELPTEEAASVAHIEACIESRGATPSSRPAAVPAASTATTSDNAAPASNDQARARTMSFRSRGVFNFTATEKDCEPEVDKDGRWISPECPICLEEYEVGDEMGRLECLCMFHRPCIRNWFGRKGFGCCPTHPHESGK